MATRKPLTLDEAVVSVLLAGDIIDPVTLGTNTPDNTKYLSGDGSWQPTDSLMPTDPATGTNQETQITLETATAGGIGAPTDASSMTTGSLNAKVRGLISLLTGRGVAAAPVAGTVGTSSAILVAANATRTGLVLTNQGPGNVFLGDSQAAALYAGITLFPGGSWVMDRYTFTQGAINAISDQAGTKVGVQEYN